MRRTIIFCLGCFIWNTVLAFQFQFKDTLVITEPVFKNLYLAGANVIVNAPVHGDLIVAGGTVHINDTVTNDIILVAGNVIFNGYVGQDIRCAGATVHVLKDVAGEVIITGGTVTIDKSATIGSLNSRSSDITVDGKIKGLLKSVSGNLVLNGIAMGEIDCKGGGIAINGKVQGPATLAATDYITINSHAHFDYDVRYWVPDREVNFKQTLRSGHAVYDQSLKVNYGHWYYLGNASLVGLLIYIGAILLLLALLEYLFSAILSRAGNTVRTSVWKSLGYGFLFWIGVPILIAISLISIIGVPIGLILLCNYIFFLLISPMITSVVAANWLNNGFNSNWNSRQLILAAFGIFIVLKILTFTPFLGIFLLAVFICLSFGAIILNMNWRKKRS